MSKNISEEFIADIETGKLYGYLSIRLRLDKIIARERKDAEVEARIKTYTECNKKLKLASKAVANRDKELDAEIAVLDAKIDELDDAKAQLEAQDEHYT